MDKRIELMDKNDKKWTTEEKMDKTKWTNKR